MRQPLLVCLFASLFLIAGIAAAPAPAMAATHKTKSHDFKNLHKKKKTSSKKTAAKKTPVVAANRTAILNSEPVDPAASEPSEVIMAIKNRAQRTFWDNKKTPAQMQAEFDRQQGAAAKDNASLKRVFYSDVAGVTFDDQPLRMPPSETFSRSLDKVAFELGVTCQEKEYLGWPLAQSEQARVDSIFSDTVSKMKMRGYSITPRNPRAAGADVSVFTATRRAEPVSRSVLGIWSAGDAGLLLMMCDTAPSAKEVVKAKPAKTKAIKKKKSSRKKASAPATKRPEVIPGAAPKSEEGKTDSSTESKSEATGAAPVQPAAAFNPDTKQEAAPAPVVVEPKAEPAPAPAPADPKADPTLAPAPTTEATPPPPPVAPAPQPSLATPPESNTPAPGADKPATQQVPEPTHSSIEPPKPDASSPPAIKPASSLEKPASLPDSSAPATSSKDKGTESLPPVSPSP